MARVGVLDNVPSPLYSLQFGVLNPEQPKLADITGQSLFREEYQRQTSECSSTVGLEIELEDYSDSRYAFSRIGDDTTRWITSHDGSLRNGRELVTHQGSCGRNLLDIYRDVCSIRHLIEGDGVSNSWRAALQMHVGVGHARVDYLRVLMLAYAVLEPSLYGMAGYGRHQSNFCVPWCTMPDTILSLLNESSDSMSLRRELEGFPKYSGLNLSPITTMCTVEFRHAQTPVGAGALSKILDFVDTWYSLMVLPNMFRGLSSPENIVQGINKFCSEFIEEFGDTPEARELRDDSDALVLSMANEWPTNQKSTVAERVDLVRARLYSTQFAEFLDEIEEGEEV